MGEYSQAHKTFIGNYEQAARDLDIFKTKAGKKLLHLMIGFKTHLILMQRLFLAIISAPLTRFIS
jgi:hypothetical protein